MVENSENSTRLRSPKGQYVHDTHGLKPPGGERNPRNQETASLRQSCTPLALKSGVGLMHLKGVLKELILEMRIRKMLYMVERKKANKEKLPLHDAWTLFNWHKYIGLKEFTARLYNVDERQIEKIVNNPDIYVTSETEMKRLTEIMR